MKLYSVQAPKSRSQAGNSVHHWSMGSELFMHLTAMLLLPSHDMPTCHAGVAEISVRKSQEQYMQARSPEILQAAMCMCANHLAMLHCLICTGTPLVYSEPPTTPTGIGFSFLVPYLHSKLCRQSTSSMPWG